MKPTLFLVSLLLLAAAALSNAAEKPGAKPATPAATTTNSPSVQIIACYFHGEVRCETCQQIERQAREVIADKFKVELATKRLMFKPLNYDLPENAHFLHDYKLPCPALVLVRCKDDTDEKWKLLGETWQLVGDATRFNRYVEEEAARYLKSVK